MENLGNVINKSVLRLGYDKLKREQENVVTAFVSGRDVFSILPTGFGKTLCYACLPLIFDDLRPVSSPSIILVLTPLIAIMKDQVRASLDMYEMIL